MKDINATILVDLNQDEKGKGLLKSMNKDVRWSIKKAIKEGLIVREIRNDYEWEELYNIYFKISREGGTNPEPLDSLKKKISPVFVCKKNNKIIGGAGIRFFDKYKKEIPRLYIVASLKEHSKTYPTSLLYWNCILWAKKMNYDYFDLGGWQINAFGHLENVNKFKKKWGDIIYYKKNYPLHIAFGRKAIRNSKLMRYIWDKLNGRKSTVISK